MLKNTPLNVEIKNDQLIISIGIDTLAFAIENADKCDLYNIKIENSEGFAKDLLNELLQENEVGETLMSDMLDSAAVQAIEQGSEFIIPISEEERMERIK